MPFPRWLARVNRRVFNPLEERRGVRPVLVHTGRASGRTHHTPLDAHRVPDGYVFIPMYGPRTDWVRNVLATGHARLRVDGREVELDAPRLVRKDEVWPMMPAGTKTPPTIGPDSELLRMDVRGPAPGTG